MRLRKITSLLLFFSSVSLACSSVVLYIRPEGRVAYWADWHFLGLDKTQWDALHLNLGLLFLLAIVLHLWLNWRPLASYLKDRWRHLHFFNAHSLSALLVCLVVIAGTILQLPPMSSVLDFNQFLKNRAADRYGEPPYGHAELSPLAIICRKQDLDRAEALELLKKSGLSVQDAGQSLKEIALNNRLTPQEVYRIIESAGKGRAGEMPLTPPPGTGREKLGAIAERYGMDVQFFQGVLDAEGVEASPDQSILQIAQKNDTKPMAVYEILRSASQNSDGR